MSGRVEALASLIVVRRYLREACAALHAARHTLQGDLQTGLTERTLRVAIGAEELLDEVKALLEEKKETE